jgi:hypothetical protein
MTCISQKIHLNLKRLKLYLNLYSFFEMNDVYISEFIKTYDIYCKKKKNIQTHMPRKTFQIHHMYVAPKNSIVDIVELTIIQYMVSMFLFNGEFEQLGYFINKINEILILSFKFFQL